MQLFHSNRIDPVTIEQFLDSQTTVRHENDDEFAVSNRLANGNDDNHPEQDKSHTDTN